jgi:O-methyltransferase
MSNETSEIVRIFNLAVKHHNAGNLAEAAEIYADLVARYPSFGQAHLNLATVRLVQQDQEGALRHLVAATAAMPGDPAVRNQCLSALIAAGRLQDARQVLDDGLQQHGYRGLDALNQSMNLMIGHQRQATDSRRPVPLPDIDDPVFAEILERAWGLSMSSVYGLVDSYYDLYHLARHVVTAKVPGDFVECGVYAGGMSLLTALTWMACGDASRHLYLYDTFEGMPSPTGEDGLAAAAAFEANTVDGKRWAAWEMERVAAAMAASGYPPEKIHVVKGMVEDTIPVRAPERIAILRLDTDFYSSIRHCLAHLYPRLSSGGGLVLDDYGYMPGARKAVDEYLETLSAPPRLHRINFTVRSGMKP